MMSHITNDGISVKAVIYICLFNKNWEMKFLLGVAIVIGKYWLLWKDIGNLLNSVNGIQETGAAWLIRSQ